MEISLWNLYVNIGAKGLKGLLNAGHDVSGLWRHTFTGTWYTYEIQVVTAVP